MDGYLTKREAAQYLHVHPRTLERYIKSGRLKAYRGEQALRFKKEDLDKALTPVVSQQERRV